MPIYEYVCEKCGDHLEVMQKVSDPPLKRCKKCRGKLEKLVSRTAFQLKGSGWYKTDYASKPAASKDKSEKSVDAKSESSKSETGKSETGSSTATSGGAAAKD